MHEACGVFGIVEKVKQRKNFRIHQGLGTVEKAFNDEILKAMGPLGFKIFFALKGLQHRGQASTGMATSDNAGIGHNRYATTGKVSRANVQPIEGSFNGVPFAVSHNGNLGNTLELKQEAEKRGAVFEEDGEKHIDSPSGLEISDTRVIVKLIEISSRDSFFEALNETLPKLQGAFSLAILYRDEVIGVRDSRGIRPLCLGESDEYYALSSESCSLDHLGIKLIRDVNPGELVVINSEGIRSVMWSSESELKICLFEYIYFARPDSIIEGVPLNIARRKMGQYLGQEHSSRLASREALVPVLDSGLLGTLGLHDATGIRFIYEALFRAHFTFGRTFIESVLDLRKLGVELKFNPIVFDISDKQIVIVDDSIVRGTTSPRVINFLKKSKELFGKTFNGAKEVDVLLTSPPYLFPCYYGIDTWRYDDELIAANLGGDIAKIQAKIGADYLGYLSLENTIKAVVESDLRKKLQPCNFCTACFDGEYPVDLPIISCNNSK